MTTQNILTMENAGVRQGDAWLVRHVDLTLQRGEIVTLIGPNGSGKSTTARLALGLVQPDEGKVARSKFTRCSYVPQKLPLDWTVPLSVERFMQLTGRLSETELDQALGDTGSKHLRDRQMHSLSGGEFQRIMLARAIARKPDFLVLDEPAQGVDFSGEIALYDLISNVREKLECAILLVSHDLHIVMAATDRVLCLNGHVCCHGTPTSVAASPEYQNLFGHRAAGTLAVYQHDHDHTHLPDGRVRHADGTISDQCGHDHSHGEGKDAGHAG